MNEAGTGSESNGGRGKLLLGLGCLGLVASCCISGGVIAWYANTQVGRIQPASIACDGSPVEGASAYQPGQRSAVAGFSRGSSSWTYSGTLIPSSWNKVEDAADVQVVLCFEEPTRELLQTCPYENGIVLNRYRQIREVRGVEAETGRTLFSRRLAGAPPEACPTSVSSTEVYGVDVSSHGRESVGASVGSREIGDTLGGFFLRGEALAP